MADQLGREGRLAWRELMLRVPLPRALFDDQGWLAAPGQDHTWCMAMPDVFSIRRSAVEACLEPVHEIKVTRADLLGDLRKPAKRSAYLAMALAQAGPHMRPEGDEQGLL